MDEVTDEPLYRDRVCGIDIGKAQMVATIRVPPDKDPARRMAGTRTFGTAKKEVLVKMLLLFVSALVLIDTVFFTALTSLLPHHSHAAHLAKSGAGIFVAGYPRSTLGGALPGGLLAARLAAGRWWHPGWP